MPEHSRQEPLPGILLLGVGNILLTDEGTGIHVIRQLSDEFQFSSNVTLLDGGTLGLRLMDPISRCEHLIIVDIVKTGAPAGTLYRFTLEDFRKCIKRKNSLHQMGLLETLTYIQMTGVLPKCVIVGIEPENYADWGTTLTGTISAQLDEFKSSVLAEVKHAGGSFQKKPAD